MSDFWTWFIENDTNLLLYINGTGSERMDAFWLLVTGRWTWMPLYGFLLWWVWKKSGRRGLVGVLVLLAIGLVLSDAGSVWVFKNTIKRLRPCHVEELQEVLRLPAGCGGLYGFISSHAANSFMLAGMFSALVFRRNKLLPLLLVVWATFVSYSRMYLGVHYPTDVLFGAVYGGSIGLFLGLRGRHLINL
ncbi:phosphatase PAP2 family protein [Schleiferia thermophila]|jgi:undecaprenyl-diphosphatase|uniref:Undecaprenyl-diphosphatase n=1 Tax=Schleiferia thermophila TaxID=884107 RepID=A0A369A9P0_9FLAO|nr:phosphatase PAP2 family protein [Schleiferia thermophila]KFD38331.1 hypothetical protein AT05_10715 [Schleiferia thermophila str. Yellowstone]RCX05118.1 undecaprenyl-diphosphatase [Schleiferia thermophila]GCD79365.1 phosphatase PAP2 family protein [Schleiferia thermophila]